MILTISQRNINGYTDNYIKLQELIKTHSPKIISLQETHIHSLTFTLDDFDVIGMEIESRMKLNLYNVYFSPTMNFDGSVLESLFGECLFSFSNCWGF